MESTRELKILSLLHEIKDHITARRIGDAHIEIDKAIEFIKRSPNA